MDNRELREQLIKKIKTRPILDDLFALTDFESTFDKLTFITFFEWVNLGWEETDFNILLGSYTAWYAHFTNVSKGTSNYFKHQIVKLSGEEINLTLTEELKKPTKKDIFAGELSGLVVPLTLISGFEAHAITCFIYTKKYDLVGLLIGWNFGKTDLEKTVNKIEEWAIQFNVKNLKYNLISEQENFKPYNFRLFN